MLVGCTTHPFDCLQWIYEKDRVQATRVVVCGLGYARVGQGLATPDQGGFAHSEMIISANLWSHKLYPSSNPKADGHHGQTLTACYRRREMQARLTRLPEAATSSDSSMTWLN